MASLSDGQSFWQGCNSTDPTPAEDAIREPAWEQFGGRRGGVFSFPAGWKVGAPAEGAPSLGREIYHPLNPEFCIFYQEIYDIDQFENIEDLLADQVKLMKMAGCERIQPFSFEKWFPHCQEKIPFGQISFVSSSTQDASLKRQGFRVVTSLNKFVYALQVECPINDFKSNEQLITEILNSFEINCSEAAD